MAERADDLAGAPDAFGRLWTPHRMVYIAGEKPRGAEECPFCLSPTRSDEDGLVVRRGVHAYVVMNLYPYSPGHMLVCPYRHFSDWVDATPEETREMAELSQQAIRTLARVSQPAGVNIGMNQGAVSGAGIRDHLHMHVVPRWLGDTNFMPIVAQTRVLPQLLDDGRTRLASAWARADEPDEPQGAGQ